MRRSILALLVVMFLVAHARAQSADEKSSTIAVSLSVGVTAAGVAAVMSNSDSLTTLGLLAAFVGPSIGRWYAGEASLSGIGLRALASVPMVLGGVIALERACDEEETVCAHTFTSAGGIVFLAGAGLWMGSSIADVVLAERAARRWNQHHALALAPMTFAATGSGGRTAGLGLSGRF